MSRELMAGRAPASAWFGQVPALLALFAASPAAARIAEVVVFPDRAQVTRAQTVACGPRAVAAFTGIGPAANPATFRAHTQVGSVEGLRSEEQTLAEAFAPEVKALDAQIRAAQRALAALQDDRSRWEAQARLGASYGDAAAALVRRELLELPSNAQGWRAAFQASLGQRLKAAAELGKLAPAVRAAEYKLEDLRRRRAQLSAAEGRRQYTVEVVVACPAGQRAQVELSYLVGGASWEPTYEARADEAAGRVEVSTYATVKQSTAEDWVGAKLVLSTAVPLQSATPPELAPLKVYADERKPHKKVLVRRDEEQKHAQVGDVDGTQEGGDRQALQLPAVELAQVKGDGTPARVLVARTSMRAKFSLRTAPKQLPYVFRVAELTNTAPFPLLPGPVDVFRNSGFIARLWVERTAPGAPWKLTFGLEEGLKVKRTVVEEVRRLEGLFNDRHRIRYRYQLEVGNTRARHETVVVSEHIPVSELEDVKVELAPETSKGHQVDAVDGIVSWTVRLSPGSAQRLDLAFFVDIPASYDVTGL